MCLKATPSRKVPQMPASNTSKWGRNGEERAALLRVRTGQKALRAVGGSFFKLWDSKGENLPEHTTGCSQNKGTEKLQRRASLQRTGPSPLEVGGRGEGKGANSARDGIPSHTANRPPVSIQRLPEILDGRRPPRGGSRLEASS